MIVITGGQTGVDQQALYAARDAGLHTGGWAPPNYRTSDGRQSHFLRDFGLKAYPSAGSFAAALVARTQANVRRCDAWVIVRPKASAGTDLTIRLAQKIDSKRVFVISNPDDWPPDALAMKIWCLRPQNLMIAGPRAAPDWSESYLRAFFLRFVEQVEDTQDERDADDPQQRPAGAGIEPP